jgi:hypothetical protein
LRFFAVPRFGNHLQVAGALQQLADALTDNMVVIGQ